MHFEQAGAGTPVVLVHGLAASLFSWRDVVTALSPRFKTYAVDLLGFGQSAAPAGFPYTIAAQASAVADLMKAEGLIDPILIGHSMGGGVCLHLAGMASRSGRASSSKMVLVDPVAYPPINSIPRPGPQAVSDEAMGGLPKSPAHAMAAYFLRKAFAAANQPTPAQIDGYAAGLRTASQLDAFGAHGTALSSTEAPLPSFAGIANPTLIIWGKDDPIVPLDHGDRLQRALPNATLVTIPGSGHIPHEERPTDTIAKILGFL